MYQLSQLVAFFWPFGNGWMLFWALAAVVPILIHLWYRRRYRETSWAAMAFLLAALRRHSRRLTIEQLILLALRVLILLLLAVALADPVLSLLPGLPGPLVGGGHTHWLLVLDGSYSMACRAGDQTRLDRAKQLAGQLVEHSTQGDGFTLVLMSDPPEVIIGRPAFGRDDVVEEINSIQPPHSGAGLSATLAQVGQLLEQVRQRQSRLTIHKVCFLTDMGRTTWGEAELAACRRQIGRLGQQAELLLFDVGENATANTAVTRLDISPSLITRETTATVLAEIHNFGPQPVQGRTAQLVVDGRPVQQTQVTVPAGGVASVSMTHRFNAPGEHAVELRLDEDALALDDHRWMSVPVRESVEVLCAEGKPGAARFVALALEPQQSPTPRVRVTVAADSALSELELDRFDCIFLCNVGRFGRDEAELLYDYVHDGGGLVLMLGDQVQPEQYNRVLGGELTGHRLLPARLEHVVGQAQYRFDPLEYRHPIVAPFRGHQQAGLLTTPVWRYFKLVPYDPTVAKVALAFEGGDPAIVEEPVGRGRVILYASAASDKSIDRTATPPVPWTAIHTWPSFPPLVQEMLALVLRDQLAGRNVLVGQPLQGVLRGTLAQVPLTVAAPNGQQQRVRLQVEGDDSRWMFGATRHSGIYRARFGPPLNQTQLLAVNLDTRESNLERFDPQLLPEPFHSGQPSTADDLPLPFTGQATRLFQYVLALLLVLLLTETILAWWFGRPTGQIA